MHTFFRSVDHYPDRNDACGIVMRLIDGLGYRLYWATEELRDCDYAYSAGEGTKTIGELIKHIWELVNWIHLNVCHQSTENSCPGNVQGQRDNIFELLYQIRNSLSTMDQKDLFQVAIEGKPFWHIINGPLSDALSHTGQIASFRRLNGNIVQRHYPFLCHSK